jgi:ornithine cyclodeaminase
MKQTLFLSVTDVKRLIENVGLSHLIRAVSAQIERDMQRWNDFEKSPRTANHSPTGVIELMPVSDAGRFAFKYVNGHPRNFELGLPTVMAFGCLSDVATGWPLMLSEMTILTAIRTAATSVVAARALARKDSSTMAMIGNGAQSEFQILAFADILGIRTVRLWDIDRPTTEKLLDNLDGSGLRFVCCGSAAEASAGADIVTTSTADKTYATVLTDDMVEEGMHLNAIGGDCPGKTELQADILHRAKVFVEFTPQTRVEGELQQMAESFAVTELWEVLTGRQPGRVSDRDITLFDSVGFALEDYSALMTVYELALAEGIGSEIELVPEMNNVRDLFGLLSPKTVSAI